MSYDTSPSYDLSFSNVGGTLPDNADCFLRGFLDFYGVGEAGSFRVDGDEDEYDNDCPLSRGTGWAVEAYREGWHEAARRA